MKKDIHPAYQEAAVTCGCGNQFQTRSTRPRIAVEICSACHPFYTGKQKFLDTAGMVERFQRKWSGDEAKKLQAAAAPKPVKKKVLARAPAPKPATIASQLAPSRPAAPPAPAEGPSPKV